MDTLTLAPPLEDAAPRETLRASLAPGRRLPRQSLIVFALAVVAAVAGYGVLRAAPASASTDNAYLQTDATAVAPRVKGLVAEVLVADNETVRAGQPLVRLDPEEYAARVAGAEGDLALAVAQVAASRSALARLGAERTMAADSVGQALSDVRASAAQWQRAEADMRRFETLASQGTAPRREAERARADALSAQAANDRSRAALAVGADQVAVIDRRRAELEAGVQAALARQAKAKADLDLARIDAEHAVIRAPIAGVVGDRQAHPGDYVQPGTRLLTLVPQDALYITANFKETQTARMVRGERAEVTVDALPGVKLKARVQSLAPGSGSQFALLPFEPATGNFTKIVQRVPVRLVFDAGQPQLAGLRPGLSARVKV
ncbi:MAG TPA: HlyD family secretion protein, partial [Phenylobacterium sp.]